MAISRPAKTSMPPKPNCPIPYPGYPVYRPERGWNYQRSGQGGPGRSVSASELFRNLRPAVPSVGSEHARAGVGRRLGRLNGLEGYPVLMDNRDNNLGTPRTYYMNNRWTPDHPDSRFPRVWTGSSPNAVLSDVWLSNAAYFRIKTLQVGYTIPKIGKNINNFRLYLNAQDAFTFTRWEGLDPERDGGNGGYPRMATYSIGLRFTIL